MEKIEKDYTARLLSDYCNKLEQEWEKPIPLEAKQIVWHPGETDEEPMTALSKTSQILPGASARDSSDKRKGNAVQVVWRVSRDEWLYVRDLDDALLAICQ